MKLRFDPNWLSLALLFVSSAFLLVTRLIWPFTNVDFGSDQSRDMIVSNKILQGMFPAYGVPTSRGFDLFPQFYYVTAFFNVFSKDPIVNIMLNAVLNIGFVILLYFLVQKVFAFSPRKRLFGALSVFFFAFNYQAIWQANLMWNPNYLPFVLLIYLFTIFWLFDKKSDYKNVKWNSLAAFTGFLISFMMSLHSVAIFVLPFFSVVFGFFYLKQCRKQFFMYSTLGWFIPSIPYFASEFAHRFTNTKMAIIFILKSGTNFIGYSPLDQLFFRVHNFFLSWLNLISTIYLPATYGTFVGIIGLISLAGFFVYNKENKVYIQILSILAVVYLFVHSSLTGIDYIHYIYMVYFLPPIGFFNFILYLKNRNHRNIIISITILAVLMGFVGNAKKVLLYSQQKYGLVHRFINTGDYYDIFAIAQTMKATTLCIPQKWDDRPEAALNYYKDYVVNIAISITKDCKQVTSKKIYLVDKNNSYPITSNDFESSSVNLIKDTNAYQLYETKS